MTPDFDQLAGVTLDGDDHELDDVLVLRTHAAVLESSGIDCGVALLGFLHRSGEIIEVGFLTFGCLFGFVATSNPQRIDIIVGETEDEREIEAAVRAGARGRIH